MTTNRNRLLAPLLGAALALTLVPISSVWAQDAVSGEIIALAKAQWAAENAMKPTTEAWANVADDYTEFNGDYSTRIDGKAMAMKFAEAGSTSTDLRVAADMANVKVQVYNGDTAILTYNYVGLARDKDGKMTPGRAKSTRVYVKQGANWVLVHANFAPDPLPK